jgi:hypothetical protein
MYTARWAQFPLENSTLDAAQQSANALERSKVLLQLPTPPGESLNPLNEEAYIRAEVESRKGNAAAAKGICDVRLPALGRAGTAEVTLLLARSRYEIKLAGNKGEKENAIAMAKMAIDDATRASDIALLRDTIAGARSLAALARFKAYEISNNSEYFDKAREDIKAVILLAPRRSATADLCGWGADKLLFTKCESLPADKLAAKFDLVSEAIDWQNKSCVWGNVSNLQNRRQDYLVGFLRLGVKQCSSLLDQPPSAAGKKKYLEETGKWKEILLKIPERASKRAELAAELGELEQKLNKKLNEAEPQQ